MSSTAALARVARSAGGWEEAWGELDEYFKKKLTSHGLDDPLLWAGLRGDRGRLTGMLASMSLLSEDSGRGATELDWCLGLQRVAREVGQVWVEGQACMSNLQLFTEVEQAKKKARTSATSAQLQRLSAAHVQAKPAEWKGKTYHRAEEAGDETGRRKAEVKEREKQARRIFKILMDAQLPFALEAETQGWHALSPEAGRCLRGLRAATLRKRAGDVGPFLRYLQAERGKYFPTEKVDLLSYFAVRAAENAAGSVYRSLTLAIQFFEIAGELPKEVRLTEEPGVWGAVKEFESRRRLQAADLGEKMGKK